MTPHVHAEHEDAGAGGYAERALAHLKARGYRITGPRRRILELLERSEEPLSSYEIRDRMREMGERIDAVSVYRVIECLEENGLLHRVLASGKVRRCHIPLESSCQLHQQAHCHHNLVCRGCGRIQEIHCTGLEAMEEELSSRSGFRIETHQLEFSGLCAACQLPKGG